MTSSYDDLIMLLSAGISQRRLYSASHPRVVECSDRFTQHLLALLRTTGQESFFIGVADGKLVHRGRYLVGSTIVGKKLIKFAEDLCCGGFLLRAGVDAQEMRELFGLAAELTDPVESLPAARALLRSRTIPHIELSPPYEDAAWFGQDGANTGSGWDCDALDPAHFEALLRSYQSVYHTVETAHTRACGDQEIDVDAARAASESILKTCAGTFTDLMQIVRYPDQDSYTVGHSVRVAMIAVLIGHRFGLPAGALTELGSASLLHDIGKAKVPREILYKPGRLDEHARRLVMEHCAVGARMLLESRKAGPLAIAAAWGHHLRCDGGGYPPRPAWTVRSNLTELLHLCDVFEALTAVRPYKPAHSPRRAYELMLSDPGEFEPRMLAAFAAAMGVYPPGSRVHLSTGERGVVVAAGRDIARPQVRLTRDRVGLPIAPTARQVIDLGEESAREMTIVRLLQDDAELPSGVDAAPMPA